jgi:nitrite reductase/ring-hydroxylating ferredoxin subunit
MFLRRRDLMVGLFGAAISFISGSAVAAEVPKLKCTRVGQTVIYRNQKFTCIKKSGKLVWGKGVPVPVKSASPKPSPSASPSASAKPSAIPSASASPSASATQSSSPSPTSTKRLLKVADSTDISVGGVKVIELSRATGLFLSIVLIRESTGLRALQAECPHAGAIVKTNGGPELLCPAHNSLFSVKNGEVLRGPANSGLKSYEVSETGGEIFVTF